MGENKKYYWLKLKDNFFDDDTISFIEEQENGVHYVNFYLKLCLKALKTEGVLIRLVGETFIPYDIKSLAKLTNTEIDTARVAMELFKTIGLVKILETGEIFLTQINELIGSETDKAQIMRRKRAQEKLLGNNVTEMLPNSYIEKEIEIDKEKDIYKGKSKRFTPPTIEEVTQYCRERNNNVNPQKFIDFYQSKDWMVGKNKMKDWKACIRTWEQKETKEPRVAKEPTYSSENNMDIDEDILKKYL